MHKAVRNLTNIVKKSKIGTEPELLLYYVPSKCWLCFRAFTYDRVGRRGQGRSNYGQKYDPNMPLL